MDVSKTSAAAIKDVVFNRATAAVGSAALAATTDANVLNTDVSDVTSIDKYKIQRSKHKTSEHQRVICKSNKYDIFSTGEMITQ